MTASLESLGWNSFWEAQMRAHLEMYGDGADGCSRPGRVTGAHKGAVSARTIDGDTLVDLSLPLNCDHSELWPPIVGDWVVVGTQGEIRTILPRRTYLERPGLSRGAWPQPMVANVDVVCIVEPVVPAPSAGRIERISAIARRAGVRTILVLSKSDLFEGPLSINVSALARETVDSVIQISRYDELSMSRFVSKVGIGNTAALFGRSGAGKSTLVNMVTGSAQETKEVRRTDGKGRHATTARGLFAGSNVVIVDTPGLRAVPAVADVDVVKSVFFEIEAYSRCCEFRDCTHSGEPGCAVRNAVDSGDLDAGRFQRYLKMVRESNRRSIFDSRVSRMNERRNTKNNSRGRRESMKLKGRDN